MDTVTRGLSRNVLVLGADGNNIGGAIAERVAWLGHHPITPTAMQLDVTEEHETIVDFLHSCRPDAVVYSVGVNELEWSSMLTRDSFERIMFINVWGFINVLKALQAMGRSYSVLAVTSDAAYRPMRTSMAYCASKAALDMAVRVAARELSGEGWRINAIAPGKVAGTPMTEYVDRRVMEIRHFKTRAEAERYEMAGNPINRALLVSEVAAAACDVLLSDAIGWTGDIITVNGGR